jgi:hypothetical protein
MKEKKEKDANHINDTHEHIGVNNETVLDDNTCKKMLFIYNSLQNGWSVKKVSDKYIFRKKHKGKREIYQENYLSTFIKENCSFKQ